MRYAYAVCTLQEHVLKFHRSQISNLKRQASSVKSSNASKKNREIFVVPDSVTISTLHPALRCQTSERQSLCPRENEVRRSAIAEQFVLISQIWCRYAEHYGYESGVRWLRRPIYAHAMPIAAVSHEPRKSSLLAVLVLAYWLDAGNNAASSMFNADVLSPTFSCTPITVVVLMTSEQRAGSCFR
mgnify:CR=1 FL=1